MTDKFDNVPELGDAVFERAPTARAASRTLDLPVLGQAMMKGR